jgi:hypothetical protein
MKKFTLLLPLMLSLMISPAFSHSLISGSMISHSWTENSFPNHWPAPKFETFICDDRTLVWNNITDMKKLTSGIEKYDAVELAPNLLQVSWKESPETTNYGIIWTLDFNKMSIHGVLVNIDSHVNYVVSGNFSQQKSLKGESYLASCS